MKTLSLFVLFLLGSEAYASSTRVVTADSIVASPSISNGSISITPTGTGKITTPAAITDSVSGAASTPAVKLTGTWFTGGSTTTTKPQFLVETSGATSNNWPITGTGIGVNAASGFTGYLLDLQTNGADKFSVDASGNSIIHGATTANGNEAASTPTLLMSGTWFTGGSNTTTKPNLLVEPTGTTSNNWASTGTGIGVNATSGFTGFLMDLQTAAADKFYVDASGNSKAFGSFISPIFTDGDSTDASSGAVRLGNAKNITWGVSGGGGSGTSLSVDASNNLSYSGTAIFSSTPRLLAAAFPALTGDVTTTAGAVATTVAKIAGTTVSGTSGSGNVVFGTGAAIGTPTLTTATFAGTTTFPALSAIDNSGFARFGRIATGVAPTLSYGLRLFEQSTTVAGISVESDIVGVSSGATKGVDVSVTLDGGQVLSSHSDFHGGDPALVNSTTITTAYGLRLDNITAGGTNYEILAGTAQSRFNGKLGVKMDPSKDLDVTGTFGVTGTSALGGVATFTVQPIMSSLTASQAVFTDGSKGLVSNAITGSGNVVMSASPTLTGTTVIADITHSGGATAGLALEDVSGRTATGAAANTGAPTATAITMSLTAGATYVGTICAVSARSSCAQINIGNAGGSPGVKVLTQDVNADYTATSNNASTINVTWNSGTGVLSIQNNTASASVTFRLALTRML